MWCIGGEYDAASVCVVWCIGAQYGAGNCVAKGNVSGGRGCVWCIGGQYGAVRCVRKGVVSGGSGGCGAWEVSMVQ